MQLLLVEDEEPHLTRLLPEHFGYVKEIKVFQLLGAPLRVRGFVLKVQLLRQRTLQVLTGEEKNKTTVVFPLLCVLCIKP